MNVIHHEIGRDKLYKTWNTPSMAMIIYTYSDGGSIVFADKMLPIKRGALCFIAPSTRHYTMPSTPSEYDRSKIFIPPESLSRLLNALPEGNEMRRLFSQSSAVYANIPEHLFFEIEKIYAEAHRAMIEGDCFEEALLSSFLGLMLHLKRHTVQHIAAPDDFLSKTIGYINANYSKKISLANLCDNIHMSKYHFCRRFKSMMGITVADYLRETRISNAKSMLADSKMSIDEIADACGFSSLSYFSQIFKSCVGMSASQYRKARQNF